MCKHLHAGAVGIIYLLLTEGLTASQDVSVSLTVDMGSCCCLELRKAARCETDHISSYSVPANPGRCEHQHGISYIAYKWHVTGRFYYDKCTSFSDRIVHNCIVVMWFYWIVIYLYACFYFTTLFLICCVIWVALETHLCSYIIYIYI